MKLRTLTVPLVFLLPWVWSKTGQAATTLLASYGAFEQGEDKQNFYTLEAASARGNLADFEFTSLNHVDETTVNDSIELISSGLGFDFAPFRLHADIGYLFSIDKYALDEIDYGISRSIIGGGLNLDLQFIQIHSFSRSYVPSGSAKARIDSFSFTYNPYPYQQSQVGLTIRLGLMDLFGETGRFDKLRGRYDILGDNFLLELPAVSYAKAGLVLRGSKKSILRLEAHKVLDDHDRRTDFHKLIGSAMHRDAIDGGSLGIGFEF